MELIYQVFEFNFSNYKFLSKNFPHDIFSEILLIEGLIDRALSNYNGTSYK